MASTERDPLSPSESHDHTTDSGDDEMDFELASSAVDEDESDDMNGERTLYFDAEEGTLIDEDGEEVILEMGEDEVEFVDDEDDDDDEEEDENENQEEQSQTPQPEPEASAAAPQRATQTLTLTQQQILQLLSHAGIRGIFHPTNGGITTRSAARAGGNARHVALDEDDEDEEDEYDDDEEAAYLGFGRRRRARRRTVIGDRYPKIPSEEGAKLMDDGSFGVNDRCDHTACGLPFAENTLGKRKRLARRMFDREMGVENRGRARVLGSLASQDLIPGSKADLIINLNARCYSGQFSEDGSFFFACGQDFKVRMYDTSNPYDWKYYKTVHYYGGQWTITDATLSPDNKWLAYSSIRSQICLANTDQSDNSEPSLLDFSDMGNGGHGGRGGNGWGRSRGHFGIWSLRFSGDGNEIVAGTSDYSVYVYDLETRRSILQIPGHTDDVNAVCFGDKMSPHILYSGSDDTTLKVWDRRSLSSMRPAGMFLGHTEGLTYIDSKGDGRYVISNAKDQTCKLWDLRKMINTDVAEKINPQEYTTNFDYRYAPYDVNDHVPHPHDCSLVTFRGHRVLNTLIRCHFSPQGSTNGRYVYSGSHDGKIYIWNLDGTPASEPINVLTATKNSRPASDRRHVDRYDYYGHAGEWKTIVRDASWHPSAPVIAATSWNGWDHGLGTCTVHSWVDKADGDEVGGYGSDANECDSAESFARATPGHGHLGSTPMGARVSAELRHDERFYASQQQDRQANSRRLAARQRAARLTAQIGLGALWNEDDDDDDDDDDNFEEA